MPSWDDIKNGWSAALKAQVEQRVQPLIATVQSAPETYKQRALGFIANLNHIWEDLQAIRTMLQENPKLPWMDHWQNTVATLEEKYWFLASGLMQQSQPVSAFQAAPVGNPMIFLAVGGVAIALIGIVFAVAYYEDAAGTREQTAYYREELKARVESMRTGQQLPANTTSPSPKKEKDGDYGLYLIGFVAAAGLAAAVVPVFFKGKR